MIFRKLSLSLLFAAAFALGSLGACSDDSQSAEDGGSMDQTQVGDGPQKIDGNGADAGPAADVLPGCIFDPGAADRERVVIVSRPYDESYVKANTYEVLHLSAAGVLTQPNLHFEMKRNFSGEIVFSADGRFGYSSQEDGSIGIFRVEADRSVTVLEAAFDPGFYVSRLVMGPEGRRLFALNSQWRDNGGGIYQLEMGCDGKLTSLGLLSASKLPYDMAFLSSSLAVVAARNILDSPEGHDVHLLSLAATPSVTPESSLVAGGDAFGDDDNSVSDIALTTDQRYALVADDGLAVGSRVAVVDLGQGGTTPPTAVQQLSYSSPYALLTSPFNNAALVIGLEANRITVLDYTPGDAQPFKERGKLTTSSNTLLPANVSMIERGELKGHVFVAENVLARQIRFFSDGRVEEVAALEFGSGGPAMVGVIAVQP